MQALVVLGDQLFPLANFERFRDLPTFMAEDVGLCTHFRYHKHKLVLFLSAMRHFAHDLRTQGWNLNYHKIEQNGSVPYTTKLQDFLNKNSVTKLHVFEIEDHFMSEAIRSLCKQKGTELCVHHSPMFTCQRKAFKAYLDSSPKPFMKTFYERQRRQLGILMDGTKPVGGRFSYDTENRQKLPKGLALPILKTLARDTIDREVMSMVGTMFADHPGDTADFWFPTTRHQALEVLQTFVRERLHNFGPYQDAMCEGQSFLHHSLLSPALNTGLLLPLEVVDAVLQHWKKGEVPIESAEGLIRQILGWREFVRGMYHNFSETMDSANAWNSRRNMAPCWYDGSTGLPPLDDTIRRARTTAYSHHIERLMILGNLMNLCEIEPKNVFRWFMEMYADSADWVMSANVFGMGITSDGGLFATKPYISGSNYILKMSNYEKGSWCDIWDGLYWRFIDKHKEVFASNIRMRVMTTTLAKMQPERKKHLFSAAESFIQKVTT